MTSNQHLARALSEAVHVVQLQALEQPKDVIQLHAENSLIELRRAAVEKLREDRRLAEERAAEAEALNLASRSA